MENNHRLAANPIPSPIPGNVTASIIVILLYDDMASEKP